MLGTVKNAIVVWIGIIFLRELVTKLQVSGNSFASPPDLYFQSGQDAPQSGQDAPQVPENGVIVSRSVCNSDAIRYTLFLMCRGSACVNVPIYLLDLLRSAAHLVALHPGGPVIRTNDLMIRRPPP